MNSATALEVVRLDTKHPRAWTVMHALQDRVRMFALNFGAKDPDLLLKRVQSAFVLGMDSVACWVVLPVDETRIIGHLIACDDQCDGWPIGFVEQLQIEPGQIPIRLMREIAFELRAWSRARGHRQIMAVTEKARFPAWQRLFGFVPYRVVMTCPLSEPIDATTVEAGESGQP